MNKKVISVELDVELDLGKKSRSYVIVSTHSPIMAPKPIHRSISIDFSDMNARLESGGPDIWVLYALHRIMETSTPELRKGRGFLEEEPEDKQPYYLL
jgi:hypothetical protein